MRRRKKKAAPRRRRSSRKMGAIGKSFLMDAVGLVAGAAAARVLTSSSKILPDLDPKIKAGAVIAIGAFFPKLVKGSIGANMGAGMVAAGGLGLLQATNVLGQIDAALEIPATVYAGSDNISVISGNPDAISVVAGDDMDY